MDDGGFEFRRPPSERREPRRFEPPPWEQGAFEELERKKAQQETAEPDRSEEDRLAQPQDHEGAACTEGSGEPLLEVQEQALRDEAEAVREQQDANGGAQGATPKVDEKAVIEMMAGLASEEPRQDFTTVSVAVGWAMAALGAVLMVWAMAAFVGAAKTGLLGQLGGVGLAIFGLFFLGMGAWMVYKAFKQRGVL